MSRFLTVCVLSVLGVAGCAGIPGTDNETTTRPVRMLTVSNGPQIVAMKVVKIKPGDHWRAVGSRWMRGFGEYQKGLKLKGRGFELKSRKIKLTKKDGRIWFDSNGDGTFDMDLCEMRQGVEAYIPIPITLDGKTTSYYFWIKLGERNAKPYILTGSGCCLEANVNGVVIRLFDHNGNGLFGEKGQDRIQIGTQEPIAFAGTVTDGKAIYSLAMKMGSRQLVVERTEDKGVPATIRTGAPKWKILALLKNKDKDFTFISKNGESTVVPTGEYVLEHVELTLAGQSGRIYASNRKRRATTLKISEKTSDFVMGPPFKDLKVHAKRNKNGKIILSDATMCGQAGEIYRAQDLIYGSHMNTATFGLYLKSGDEEKHQFDMEYG